MIKIEQFDLYCREEKRSEARETRTQFCILVYACPHPFTVLRRVLWDTGLFEYRETLF